MEIINTQTLFTFITTGTLGEVGVFENMSNASLFERVFFTNYHSPILKCTMYWLGFQTNFYHTLMLKVSVGENGN